MCFRMFLKNTVVKTGLCMMWLVSGCSAQIQTIFPTEEKSDALRRENVKVAALDQAALPEATDVRSALFAFLSVDPSVEPPKELAPLKEKFKKIGILRRNAVYEFYNQHNFQPQWSKNGVMTPRAVALRDALNRMINETTPIKGEAFLPFIPGEKYTDIAAYEVAFTLDYLDYLYKIGNGFTNAPAFGKGEGVNAGQGHFSFPKALKGMESDRDPYLFAQEFEPQFYEYQNLKNALQSLHEAPRAGTVGKEKKKGAETAGGEAPSAGGGEAKGGAIRQKIWVNLERLRQIAPKGTGEGVVVNIPEYKMSYRQGDGSILDSSVIVGRIERKTPVFTDRIRYIEFNPYWNVPYKLATRDILPKLKKNPAYAASKNIKVFRGGQILDSRKIAWRNYTEKNFPFTLRQEPGIYNALGTVKFMFPNRYAVYLHDTPEKNLFKQAERYESSGCVRVAKPRELAYALLKGKLTPKQINAVFASRKNRQIPLAKSVPVYLLYLTARADEAGKITLSEDIYGYDPPLAEALSKL